MYLAFTSNAHLYRDEVFQRFAHFQALDVQMTGVQEVVDPLSALMVGLPKENSISKRHICIALTKRNFTSDCAISLS